MQACPQPLDWVTQEIDKIITQYREAYKFKALTKNHLKQIEEAAVYACGISQYFNIETAECDQLTMLGRLLGFSRFQCKGLQRPRFKWSTCNPLAALCVCSACDECAYEQGTGWCEGYWGDIYDPFEFTCGDDELYRRFLFCRIIQRGKKFTKGNLVKALNLLYDTDEAMVISSQGGVIRVAICRPLTQFERRAWHMYRAVLPVGLGVRTEILDQKTTAKPFGFGTGWGEWCVGEWARAYL
jgi:Protein of unknown function (DUF2612)